MLDLDWGTLPFHEGLELRTVGDMPPLAPALEAQVEQHWNAAAARHPIFNGRVFCADRITAAVLFGHWTEYRRVVAQMSDPALFAELRVRSVAACGVLCCPDGIVVGRRQAAAIYQAGLWQLPPAGSVDHGAATPGGADWRHAILAELQEELGIPAAAVTALSPIALVQHPSGVLDLGIRIDTALAAPEIHARHQALGDGEYEELRILPQTTLLETIRAEGGQLVPAAERLLAHLPGARPDRGHPHPAGPAFPHRHPR